MTENKMPDEIYVSGFTWQAGYSHVQGTDVRLSKRQVGYVRADLYTALEERNKRLVEALEEIAGHGVSQPAALNMPEVRWAWRCFNNLQMLAEQALAENKE